MKKNRVLIKGAGDLASGVALRLHRAGYLVAMTDLAEPTACLLYTSDAADEGLV